MPSYFWGNSVDQPSPANTDSVVPVGSTLYICCANGEATYTLPALSTTTELGPGISALAPVARPATVPPPATVLIIFCAFKATQHDNTSRNAALRVNLRGVVASKTE